MKIKLTFLLVLLVIASLYEQVFADKFNYHENFVKRDDVKLKTNGGINEVVPIDLKTNYDSWKNEFLSTEFGKNLWQKFSNNKNFTLNIIVSEKSKKGGQTSDYFWDENNNLLSASIHLGGKIDKGFPDAIYYPVMNSIDEFNYRKEISGTTLAATKFAHEFGHINQTFEANQEKFKTQNKLIPIYNSIFLKNGYNISDQKLLDLANQMGGTPTKIWEDREYWGEVAAMSFLLEANKNKPFYCNLVGKINDNVTKYAIGYEDRFKKVAETNSSTVCKK